MGYGYMDKERAETERRRKEYLKWLKEAQAETERRHKEYLIRHREFEKWLGKYDDFKRSAQGR